MILFVIFFFFFRIWVSVKMLTLPHETSENSLHGYIPIKEPSSENVCIFQSQHDGWVPSRLLVSLYWCQNVVFLILLITYVIDHLCQLLFMICWQLVTCYSSKKYNSTATVLFCFPNKINLSHFNIRACKQHEMQTCCVIFFSQSIEVYVEIICFSHNSCKRFHCFPLW